MPTRREIVEQFIPNSPMVRHLGIRVERLEPDVAELMLPFAEHNITIGDVVHGGAISTLADTACMAAAWSDDAVPEAVAGGTVSMNVDYVSAAHGVDLVATAVAVRRGRSLCFCEVTVADPAGAVIAKGLAVHRFG